MTPPPPGLRPFAFALTLQAEGRFRTRAQAAVGDGLAAVEAGAVVAGGVRCERALDLHEASLGVAHGGQRHLLLLQGVAARDATDGGLVELDRLAAVAGESERAR